jgi:hypothetical protein
MKKLTLVIFLALAPLSALAQPHPYPAECRVVAVNRYNRVLAQFWGQVDPYSRVCRNAMNHCLYEIRRRGWYDARCIYVRNR